MTERHKFAPLGTQPNLNPKLFDPSQQTFVPDLSLDSSNIRELSVRRLSMIGVKLYDNAGLNTIVNTTETNVTFDSIDFAQNVTRPSGATFTTFEVPYSGVWMLTGNIEWAAGTGGRNIWFRIDGNNTEGDGRSNDGDNFAAKHALTAIRRLNQGQVVGLRVRQASGGNLAIGTGKTQCSLAAVFVGAI
jgi:hypothetical protein